MYHYYGMLQTGLIMQNVTVFTVEWTIKCTLYSCHPEGDGKTHSDKLLIAPFREVKTLTIS